MMHWHKRSNGLERVGMVRWLIYTCIVMIVGARCATANSSSQMELATEEVTAVEPELWKDVVVDSNMSLADALRKEAPCDIKAKQRMIDLFYYSFDGKIHKGQLVIDKQLVDDIREVFDVAFETKFPIMSVIPIAHEMFYKDGKWNEDDESMMANNTSAFNYRVITGGTKLSKHAYGYAIDINPAINPYIKGDVVLPEGSVYDPNRPGTLTSDCLVVKTFLRLGWTWGGNWQSLKDYQHFQKDPALRLD